MLKPQKANYKDQSLLAEYIPEIDFWASKDKSVNWALIVEEIRGSQAKLTKVCIDGMGTVDVVNEFRRYLKHCNIKDIVCLRVKNEVLLKNIKVFKGCKTKYVAIFKHKMTYPIFSS